MKKFFYGSFAVISAITAFTYFVSCLTPYISPAAFWPMAFLALGFPYLALVIVFLAFIWVFIKRRVALYLLVLLLFGFQNIFSTVAVHSSSLPGVPYKDANTLRVMTWNVRNFDNPAVYADSPMSVRRQMFDYITKSNADVLCMQEFSEHIGPSMLSNTAALVKLGYKYFYKTNEVDRTYYFGRLISGSAIFSKLPFVDSGKTMLGDSSYPEHIAHVDVLLQNKPVRIFTTHFKSINLFATLNDTMGRISLHYDTLFVYKASKLEKLKVFAQDHARESLIAKDQLNKSPWPLVFTADMNSVPTSYPFHKMSQGLQDAFEEKGRGLGTTLDSLPKTLRIDLMLVDKRLVIKNYKRDEKHLSDHFPQYIDVSWK